MTQGDSSAPAAIAALLTMLRTSPELTAAGVLILDGPEAFDGSAAAVITVGGDPEDDTSTEATGTDEGYGGIRDRENTDIRCLLAVRYGDGGFAPVRAAAYTLLAAVRRAIIADPTLGKTVMTAGISSAALRQDISDGGPRAQLRFTVTCDAYTT